jgi:transcriptional regulator with XRE-family HTH domain
MLAEKLGISDQQLVKYENGVNRISAGRLYDAAVILRVPISCFFEGLSPAVRDPITPVAMAAEAMGSIELLDSQGMKFARALARIRNPNKRRQITKLIEALANLDGS